VACAELVLWFACCPAFRLACARSGRARHEPDRRRSRLRAHDSANDVCCVAAVLGAVRDVDLVLEIVAGIGEGDVLGDAAGLDAAFVAYLGAAEPGTPAPSDAC